MAVRLDPVEEVRAVYESLSAASKLEKDVTTWLRAPANLKPPEPDVNLSRFVSSKWAGFQHMTWTDDQNVLRMFNRMFSPQLINRRDLQLWAAAEGALPDKDMSPDDVEPEIFSAALVMRIRHALFCVLCKNFVMRNILFRDKKQHIGSVSGASAGIVPPILAVGVAPETNILQLSTSQLVASLQALKNSHMQLKLNKGTIDYLEALCMRTATELIVDSDVIEVERLSAAPLFETQTTLTTELAEQVWMGIITDISGFDLFAAGDLFDQPTRDMTMNPKQIEALDEDRTDALTWDAREEDENWIRVRDNLMKEVEQACEQAPAQRRCIALRQEICMAVILPYEYSAGVMRALTNLERQGRDSFVELFQTLTYRKATRLWRQEGVLEQGVALSLIRGGIEFQHGEDARQWLDELAPWRNTAAVCVLDRFGHKLRRCAVSYVTDCLVTALQSPDGLGASFPPALRAVLLSQT